MRHTLLTLLLTLPLLSLACQVDTPDDRPDGAAAANATQVPIGDVLWYVDYEAALAVARQEDKPLWVHFGEDPG